MTAFVADVQQVGIHRVRRAAVLVLHVDLNAGIFCILQQLLARQQVPFAPRCNDLHVRHQGISAQFETDLIIPLAGGAMRNSISTGFARDVDQAFCDQRARNRGAEQVLALIDGVGAEHRVDEVAHELFAQIIDVDVLWLDAEFDGLGACGVQLFALAQIGGEGHNFAVVVILQPFQNNGGVQSARIGKDHFLDVAHC